MPQSLVPSAPARPSSFMRPTSSRSVGLSPTIAAEAERFGTRQLTHSLLKKEPDHG